MADITVKGYVNRPKSEKVGDRTISKFTLSETYKDKKKGTKSYGWYNVTDWNNPLPPKDGAYVSLTGRLQLRQYDAKDGQKKLTADVYVNTLEVMPPKDGAVEPKATDAPNSFSF